MALAAAALAVAAGCRADAGPGAPREGVARDEGDVASPQEAATSGAPGTGEAGGVGAPVAAVGPIEVAVEAVVERGGADGLPALVVDVDPRFVVRLRIVAVQPATAWLTPGAYGLAIHSPTRTFMGKAPPPGSRLTLRLTITPPTGSASATFSRLRVE